MKQSPSLTYILAFIVLAAVPILRPSDYWMNIIILSGVYILLSQGLNIMVGVTGQFVLCVAAFYGIGAYLSALLKVKLGVPFWINLPLAGIVASLVGVGVGYICNRFRGHYVALVTLSFTVIVYEIMLNWLSLTRGPMGLINIPPPEPVPVGFHTFTFGSRVDYYVFMVILCVLCVGSVQRLINSRIGRAFLAVREDDVAAEIMGIDIDKYKIKAFIVGAWWAGIAGAFYAHYAGIIVPGNFTFLTSVEALVIVIVGGLGSIYGVLVSAIVLTFLPELLRSIQFLRRIIYGIILMVMIIFMPTGIAGLVRFFRRPALSSGSLAEPAE